MVFERPNLQGKAAADERATSFYQACKKRVRSSHEHVQRTLSPLCPAHVFLDPPFFQALCLSRLIPAEDQMLGMPPINRTSSLPRCRRMSGQHAERAYV